MRLLLISGFLLTTFFLQAQNERFFLRNGDLIENFGSQSMTFASSMKGKVMGYTIGMFNGEETLFYWTIKNEAFICTLDPAGGSQTRNPYKCKCQEEDEEGINRMTLKDKDLLLINCKGGNTYKVTPEGEKLYVK
ncbi:MAG: hypothetical protein EP305_12950 [Bacteroidetes bacterium]|nr:MAG: hypothetical protein EP305_12950 [Bacteroidota bacterium]